MPMVVDEIARRQPDLLYASVPQTTNISDGFKGVTFSDIATATDHVANWIDRAFGRSSNFDTIAYMNIPAYPLVGLASIVEKLGLDECISYGADRMYFAFTRIRG
jgi:hypothetical protein